MRKQNVTNKKKREIVLILHNIRSALNVGSMFRTADAVGVSRIYLCGYTPTPATNNSQLTTDKVAKTALGAEKTVPWEQHRQITRLIRELKAKSKKLKVIALEQSDKSKNLFTHNLKSRYTIALIVGNEVKGLPKSILTQCDEILEIPMYGKKESLNVSVATGIALYVLRNK